MIKLCGKYLSVRCIWLYVKCKMLECIRFGDCRVILGSTYPDRYDVLDFLVERHNHLQDQAWESLKTKHETLDDSILVAKNWELIYFVYFVLELGEQALLGSKRISYKDLIHAFCDISCKWRMGLITLVKSIMDL